MEDTLLDILEKLNLLRAEIRSLNEDLRNKETELVGLVKQQCDLKEEQRIVNGRKVIKEIRQRDLDIESFKETYPKLCNLAKKRDLEMYIDVDFSNAEQFPDTKK